MGKMIEVKQVDTMVVSLERNFSKLPKIPAGGREFIVMVVPWLALVFGFFTIVFAGVWTLMSLVTSPLGLFGGASGVMASVVSIVVSILALVQGVVLVLAFKPTQKKEMYGWKLLTYAVALGALSLVVNLLGLGVSGGFVGSMVAVWVLFWAVFWLAVELYLLFQIKSHYK